MESIRIDESLMIPPGRHTLAPDEVEELQRERLLRAMVTCVGRQGYKETTIADVVGVAHTSRTAFYENFSDKQDCFLAAYRQMTAGFIGASLQAAAEVSAWRDKLDAGIATYLHWMAEHPEVATSTVVEVHSAGRRALEARSAALAQWMRTLEGVAVLARRAGDNVDPGAVAYEAIVLTAEAHVHDHARRGCVERVTERAPEVRALAQSLFSDGVHAAHAA
jgi:AcrR family transcriptional regulator